MSTIEEIREEILTFRDDRNWRQYHNPKDLAISICLEAAELLEVFQWSGTDLAAESKRDKINEELADVLIYSFLMADAVGADVNDIILRKLKMNDEKYPVDKAFGSKAKYTEL